MRFFAEGVLAIDVYSLPKIREITHSNSTTVCPALQASRFPPPFCIAPGNTLVTIFSFGTGEF